MIVNQWIPAAHRGDAIGDSARRVRDLLREMGHDSDIYALTIDDDMRGEVRSFAESSARQGDVTIFHYALPSPMTNAFGELPKGRVLQYHNITPAHFFAPYQPEVFRIAALGRRDLASLAGRVSDLIVARDLAAARASQQEIARRVARGSAGMAGRLVEAARRYRGDELDAMLIGLWEADVAIKSNEQDEEPALVAWVGEHILAGRA